MKFETKFDCGQTVWGVRLENLFPSLNGNLVRHERTNNLTFKP